MNLLHINVNSILLWHVASGKLYCYSLLKEIEWEKN